MITNHGYIADLKARMGNVSFRKNSRFIVTSSAVPGTEFEIEHRLGRVPEGYIILKQDKTGNFYDSGTAWTKDKVFLKCDSSSMTATLIFI